MQHISTSSNIKVEKKAVFTSRPKLLSLYYDPPQQELTLDEFEMLSLDRLQLLRAMDVLKAKGYEEREFNSKLHEVLQTAWNSLILNSVTHVIATDWKEIHAQ